MDQPFAARLPRWLQIFIAWGLLAPLGLFAGLVLQLPRLIAASPRYAIHGISWTWQMFLHAAFSYTFGGSLVAVHGLLLLMAIREPFWINPHLVCIIGVLCGIGAIAVRFLINKNERVGLDPYQDTEGDSGWSKAYRLASEIRTYRVGPIRLDLRLWPEYLAILGSAAGQIFLQQYFTQHPTFSLHALAVWSATSLSLLAVVLAGLYPVIQRNRS